MPSYGTAPQTIDWTAKLDVSQPLEQNPMGDLKGKVYCFTYKDDSDFWNKVYTGGGTENINLSSTGRSSSGWNEVYGQYKYNINNDFQTQDYRIETIFSPTQMVSYDIDNMQPYPIVLPSKINNAPFSAEAQLGNFNYYAGNLRLLYYGGLKTCSICWYLTEDNNTTPAYGGAFSTYPYAGHLNDPYNPTIDLNYFMPYEVFFNAPNYPSAGLFNMYWSNFVAQTTDVNSKLITAYFRLRPLDMQQLDFRNQIFVDGHYYYLHSIEDYNPIEENLTKVTLLKVNNALSLNIAKRSQNENRALGRIISGPLNGSLPAGWPPGIVLPTGGVFASGNNTILHIGFVTGTNIRDKVINGSLTGGKANSINYPFKSLTSGAEIAKAHVVGCNVVSI